ncbi:MAG: AlpA family phage regulatory protein [Hydrogenophaga sp.]|uniref:helix-turn-helix transcriptional regulator n=1 Tax=Hydrogenophaga sp. TaxID=1904254 RepID=UPI001D2C9EB0|nr:AlpA family phage regulatory protein [Hydrogenophaga sp.]MBX3609199.1 AlpA family phage regulatory protein [Hydrogenophaga sp.]
MSAKANFSRQRAPVQPGVAPSKVVTRYVRLRELQTIVPFSVPTIWRKSRDGTFPPAVKLSARITAWSREAVEQWLNAKEGV